MFSREWKLAVAAMGSLVDRPRASSERQGLRALTKNALAFCSDGTGVFDEVKFVRKFEVRLWES